MKTLSVVKVDAIKVEGDLRRGKLNIKRLMEIGSSWEIVIVVDFLFVGQKTY